MPRRLSLAAASVGKSASQPGRLGTKSGFVLWLFVQNASRTNSSTSYTAPLIAGPYPANNSSGGVSRAAMVASRTPPTSPLPARVGSASPIACNTCEYNGKAIGRHDDAAVVGIKGDASVSLNTVFDTSGIDALTAVNLSQPSRFCFHLQRVDYRTAIFVDPRVMVWPLPHA